MNVSQMSKISRTSEYENDQVALLIDEFNKLYPTDEDCLHALLKLISVDHDNCPICHGTNIRKEISGRVIRCLSCRHKFWLSAGTFFNRIKVPRAWLARIWLMQKNITVSAGKFCKLLNISISTAWYILQKLSSIIVNRLILDSIKVPSSHFVSVIGKRSTETPARRKPLDEEKDIDHSLGDISTLNNPSASSELCPESSEFSGDLINNLSGQEKHVYELLSMQPLDFDNIVALSHLSTPELLSTLTMLELQGLILCLSGNQFVRKVGDKQESYIYSMKKIHGLSEVLTNLPQLSLIQKISEFICSKFHAISRKYLQRYVALYLSTCGKVHLSINSLLMEYQKFNAITNKECSSYVSPALIMLGIG